MTSEILQYAAVHAPLVWEAGWDFIAKYQTLIAGGAAIWAAKHAAAPVWQQLKDTNLQSRIVLRDALSARLNDAKMLYNRIDKCFGSDLINLSDRARDQEGDPIEVNEHAAFEFSQILRNKFDWYFDEYRDTESNEIELSKIELSSAIDDMIDTLDDIHWPAHNDQTGEDYEISDDHWNAILKKSIDSKILVADKVSSVYRCLAILKDLHAAKIALISQQIGRLDMKITSEK